MPLFTRLTITALLLTLTACGGDSDNSARNGSGDTSIPLDAPGHENSVPASPAIGESRPGGSYDIFIEVPGTGDVIAFTVHEPAKMLGGDKYPLVLYGHGGGESRITNPSSPENANQPINNPKKYIENGYGVISMDQLGHGDSSGTVGLLNPDREGLSLLALLDWAEARLDWLAYGPSVDGTDPHNLKLGAIGASYGGGFQMLINNIDPKRRLDAIIPEATWHDLNYSIAPNGVNKTIWTIFLQAQVGAADPGGSLQAGLENLLAGNGSSEEEQEFFYYRSNAYFCNGLPLNTSASSTTGVLHSPQPSGKIHALFMQGMRDTLFNFNEAYWNYRCLKQAGGDVRLRSYHFGHNATPIVPDPGIRPVPPNLDPEEFTPPLDAYDNHCGPLDGHTTGMAFMDEYVKGIAGAADIIPSEVCISLTADDGVLVDEVTTGRAGTEIDIPSTTAIAGVPDIPVIVPLGITAGPQGDVIAGIPWLEIDLQPQAEGAPGEPILFAGIGIQRAPLPGLPIPLTWELADNQITPILGVGRHELDLVGIGERLQPGDQVALLLFGGHNQYFLNGSINLAEPTLIPVSVEGKIWLPLLGPPSPAP